MITQDGPFQVLVVCTGNVCRSPQTAALLQACVDAAGEPLMSQVRIGSAGTHAIVGAPADPRAAELGRLYGAVVADHRGRQLAPQLIEQADLVLCMTREHRRAVVRQVPRASRRTFLLKEFVALVEDLARDAPPGTAGGGPPEEVIRRLRRGVDEAASHRGLIPKTSDMSEDIIDPYRRQAAVYRESAAQVYQTLVRLHRALETFEVVPPR